MACRASVIIPVYNAEKTLRRCVESVALGRERNIEIILIEDCSRDASWKLCLELKQEFPNVIAVQNEENSGVSFTRNRGLKMARGEYILFVDSDDWVSERYADTLLHLAENYPETLPICGQCFIDKVHGQKRNYIWNECIGEINIILEHDFFGLSDKFLLQQIWNKVFRRDVIEHSHLYFDEEQSMGEDFQFVLDYMEAAKIRKCVTINEPLYYYIRWNEDSLMSNFGFLQNTTEYKRIDQLYRISGFSDIDLLKQKKYQVRLNYVYHITRNKKFSVKEKINYIEQVVNDGNGRKHYFDQRILQIKEWMFHNSFGLKMIKESMQNKRRCFICKQKIKKIRSLIKPTNITIISQNCIGGTLYHDLGMKFLSPTINLFIKEPDFMRFVLNLDYYIRCPLEMRWGEEYPVGMLDDIEIHFMHYETCKEAKERWNNRKLRINWENIIILCTDRDEFDEKVYSQWKNISYPKILFTAQQQFSKDADSVFFSQYSMQGCVPDLIPNREFYKDGVILKHLKNME